MIDSKTSIEEINKYIKNHKKEPLKYKSLGLTANLKKE